MGKSPGSGDGPEIACGRQGRGVTELLLNLDLSVIRQSYTGQTNQSGTPRFIVYLCPIQE